MIAKKGRTDCEGAMKWSTPMLDSHSHNTTCEQFTDPANAHQGIHSFECIGRKLICILGVRV